MSEIVRLATRLEQLETELSEARRKIEVYDSMASGCNECHMKKLYDHCPKCQELNSQIIRKMEEYIQTLKVECSGAQKVAREALDLLSGHLESFKTLI